MYGKDTFVYQAAYGPGIQRYLNDTSGLGIDAALVSNYEKYLRALPTTATYFGYQHWWVPKVRSNVVYGFAQVNNISHGDRVKDPTGIRRALPFGLPGFQLPPLRLLRTQVDPRTKTDAHLVGRPVNGYRTGLQQRMR